MSNRKAGGAVQEELTPTNPLDVVPEEMLYECRMGDRSHWIVRRR